MLVKKTMRYKEDFFNQILVKLKSEQQKNSDIVAQNNREKQEKKARRETEILSREGKVTNDMLEQMMTSFDEKNKIKVDGEDTLNELINKLENMIRNINESLNVEINNANSVTTVSKICQNTLVEGDKPLTLSNVLAKIKSFDEEISSLIKQMNITCILVGDKKITNQNNNYQNILDKIRYRIGLESGRAQMNSVSIVNFTGFKDNLSISSIVWYQRAGINLFYNTLINYLTEKREENQTKFMNTQNEFKKIFETTRFNINPAKDETNEEKHVRESFMLKQKNDFYEKNNVKITGLEETNHLINKFINKVKAFNYCYKGGILQRANATIKFSIEAPKKDI